MVKTIDQPDLLTPRSFRHEIEIDSVDLFPISTEIGVSPSMVLGTMPKRPALLVRLTDPDGCFGWGEIWANFPPRANLHKAHLVEDVIVPKITGFRFTDPVEVTEFLRRSQSNYFLHIGQKRVFEHILAGLDTALWDLALRRSDRSFAEHMGLGRTQATSYASSINPPDLETMMERHAGYGQKYFKLKLGFDEDGDRAFVAKAHKLLQPGARIMVDSNQSWSLETASRVLTSLEDYDLVFAEEPIPADAGLAEWESLAKTTTIPLAGGENIYGIDDFLSMASAGVKYLQPDVAKWGGVSGALALNDVLPDGVQLWPHFMGTGLGQMAALATSAAVKQPSVCEMDVNDNPLRSGLCGDILNVSDGNVALPLEPGLVAPPKAHMLTEFAE